VEHVRPVRISSGSEKFCFNPWVKQVGFADIMFAPTASAAALLVDRGEDLDVGAGDRGRQRRASGEKLEENDDRRSEPRPDVLASRTPSDRRATSRPSRLRSSL
jgi:hypothetical protein